MKRALTPLLALLLALPAGGAAQVVWDAPSLLHPGSPAGLSILLAETHPAEGLGALGIWRQDAAPMGLGFRASVAEGPGDDLAASFGVDVSGPLAGPDGPGEPQLLWWTGAGIGVGDEVVASFPLGLVVGWQARDEGVSFMPWVGGHLALDVMTGPGDDLELDGALDLGVDLDFDGRVTVRFGAALGDREALAVGVHFPTTR